MATEIARAMVTEYGMSEKVGPMSLGHEEPNPFFGGSKISGATAQTIDEEVTRLLNEAHDQAERILDRAPRPARQALRTAAGRRDDRRGGPRGLRGRHEADPDPETARRDMPVPMPAPTHAAAAQRMPEPTPQTPPMPAIE